MLLFFCSFSIAFSCSLLAPAPFSSGARKKKKWQKKKQWVQRDFNAIFFCMPPVSRFCAGARSWRVFFFLVFFFPVSVYENENKVANLIYSLCSVEHVCCVCMCGCFFLTSVSYISFMGCKFEGSLLFRYLELKSELWGERRKNGVIGCLVALLKRRRKWCVRLFSKTPFLFICGPASAWILSYNFSPSLHPSFSPISTVQFDSVLVLKTSKRPHF